MGAALEMLLLSLGVLLVLVVPAKVVKEEAERGGGGGCGWAFEAWTCHGRCLLTRVYTPTNCTYNKSTTVRTWLGEGERERARKRERARARERGREKEREGGTEGG